MAARLVLQVRSKGSRGRRGRGGKERGGVKAARETKGRGRGKRRGRRGKDNQERLILTYNLLIHQFYSVS